MYKTPLLLVLLLVLLAPLSVNAVIYKSVDSEGEVVYTDKPSPGAEEIPEPSPNTVQMPKPQPKEAVKKDAGKDTVYTSLLITSPGANETIHSNPGLLSINLSLTPKLNIKAGDSVNIMVDGYVLIKNSSQLSAQIPDISRGSHRVQALVTNKQGVTLIKSSEVQIFMMRQSLGSKTSSNPPGPKDTSGKSVTPGPQGTYFKPGPVPPPPASEP